MCSLLLYSTLFHQCIISHQLKGATTIQLVPILTYLKTARRRSPIGQNPHTNLIHHLPAIVSYMPQFKFKTPVPSIHKNSTSYPAATSSTLPAMVEHICQHEGNSAKSTYHHPPSSSVQPVLHLQSPACVHTVMSPTVGRQDMEAHLKMMICTSMTLPLTLSSQ
jgi:hypothetical protein